MLNRRLHRIIVGGITGIVLCSIVGAWLLISRISLFFAFICFWVVIALAILLIRKIERADHQLKIFFSAIAHNDFNVYFSEKEDDPFLTGLFRDMNRIMMQLEQKQTELEERRLYYESIIRVLTHEIRNSIAPIVSLSSDLIKYNDEYGKEETIDGLLTINRHAGQLNTFLNAYHRLIHLPKPVREKVEIGALFDKLNRLLSSEPGCRNICYDSAENMEILFDRNLITLALINLIRNALQATANHPEPRICVEAGKIAATSFIQVVDNGEGISQDQLEDIFIPFYSTKAGGSGIGLPLSRRIMQLHGGELTVSSSPGEQTVFKMTFPE